VILWDSVCYGLRPRNDGAIVILWVLRCDCGDSVGFCGILWDSVGFCGILWDSVGATGLRVTICDSCDTCDSVGATGLGLRPRNDGLL